MRRYTPQIYVSFKCITPAAGAIEAYRSWQQALERHGCTPYAMDLFLELCRHIEPDPCLDVEGFEAVLEQLHDQAYPDARTRPPRLTAGELVSILE